MNGYVEFPIAPRPPETDPACEGLCGWDSAYPNGNRERLSPDALAELNVIIKPEFLQGIREILPLQLVLYILG